MHIRRPFFSQKLALYFDENCPSEVVRYFRSSGWKKKLRVSSAQEYGHVGKPDSFHYSYCKKKGYVLVTLDLDFNNDHLYPFTYGPMAGIIMLRASPSDTRRVIFLLERLLDFVLSLPFPKSFMRESKFIAALDVVTMRGRNDRTREVREVHIKAGVTTVAEVRAAFDY